MPKGTLPQFVASAKPSGAQPSFKKDDGNSNEISEHEVSFRSPNALEKNNKIAKNGPPYSSPLFPKSPSFGDSGKSPDRMTKKAKKLNKDHLMLLKTVKEKISSYWQSLGL